MSDTVMIWVVFVLVLFGKALLAGWRVWNDRPRMDAYHARKLHEGEQRLRELQRATERDVDPFEDWDEEFEDATGKKPIYHLPPPNDSK